MSFAQKVVPSSVHGVRMRASENHLECDKWISAFTKASLTDPVRDAISLPRVAGDRDSWVVGWVVTCGAACSAIRLVASSGITGNKRTSIA